MELFQKKKSLSSFQIIIFGFLAVILVGTLLLMLPFASREPGSAPFLDALFTATSATCVTGLIVHDTATYWSCFGQVVILLLIQIGGMGVVTITIAVAMVSGKKIGLMQRSLMQESISAPQRSYPGVSMQATGRRHCPFYRLFPERYRADRTARSYFAGTCVYKGLWSGKRDLVWCFSFHFCFLQRRL